MNLLNQQLKAIQSSMAYAKKKLDSEPDRDKRVKIAQYIARLGRDEKDILKELDIE